MSKKNRKKKSADAVSSPPQAAPVDDSLKSTLPLRYRLLIVVLLLVIAVAVLYPGLVFHNNVIGSSDAEAAASFATPIKQGMAEGTRYPLWNPYLFAGMPSYESLSYTPHVYPVSSVYYVLIKWLKFPRTTWLLFHVFMLGLGVAVLLMEKRIHFLVAAAAGIVMMWMPNNVAVGVHGHGSQAMSAAYLPWALLVWDRLWRGKGYLLNGSMLALLLGFQLLRGHLQISYYTLALVALYVIFFGIAQIRDGLRKVDGDAWHFTLLRAPTASPARRAFLNVAAAAAIFAVIVVAALAMSSVLFMPVQDYAQYSIRGASESGGVSYDYATAWSLKPSEAVTFVVPFSYGFGKLFYHGGMPFTDYPNYVGIIVFLFSVLAVVAVRGRFVWFLVFVITVATLVSFGKYLPVLYGPLFKFAPYFDKFRVPVMVLIVQQLAFALLFGIGLGSVARLDASLWRKRSLMLGAGAAVLFVVALLSADYWTGAYARGIAASLGGQVPANQKPLVAAIVGDLLHRDLIKQSAMLLVAFVLLFLYFRRTIKGIVLVSLIGGLAVVDMYVVDRYVIHAQHLFDEERFGDLTQQFSVIKTAQERDRFLQSDGVIEFLKQDTSYFRVFPYDEFSTNRYMNFGIASIGGYHPAKLALYEEFIQAINNSFRTGNFGAVDMMNARYFVGSSPLPDSPALRPVWEGTDYRGARRYIYENTRVLPRAYLVHDFEVVSDERGLDLIVSGGRDWLSTVLLDRAPAVTPVSSQGASATISDYRLNEIHIDASLPDPAIMVLSEVYYPKWKVVVDGEAAEMLRANHVLRAVALPAGDHEVVFRYDSSVLKRGLTVSIVTVSLVAMVFLYSLFMTFRGRQWKLSS